MAREIIEERDAAMDEDAARTAAAQQRDAVSAALGQYMLKGHCMLADECSTCGTILMRDRDQRRHCVYCEEIAPALAAEAAEAAETEAANTAAAASAAAANVSAVSPSATESAPRFSMRTPVAAPDSVARRMLLDSPNTRDAQLSASLRARLEGTVPSCVVATGLATDQPVEMPTEVGAQSAASLAAYATGQLYGGATALPAGMPPAAAPHPAESWYQQQIPAQPQPTLGSDLPALLEQARIFQQQHVSAPAASVQQRAAQNASQERDAQQSAVVLQVRYSAQIAVQMLNTKLQQASQLLAHTPTVHETVELCQLMTACGTAIQTLKQLL